MKIGSLIMVCHFTNRHNGNLGIVVDIRKRPGFKTIYRIRIPSYDYEIGLTADQCEVINADK